MEVNALLFLLVEIQKESEQRERYNLRSGICLTFTELPSSQEKLSCLFLPPIEGKLVGITLVLFRL